MLLLAIAAGFAGAATLIEIIIKTIDEWKQLHKQEKNLDRLLKKHNVKLDEKDLYYMSFEEFSEKMRNKETMKLGE
jgi:hypothetical protein